jgi:pimeloyl-ACP methyl ester carboxylesterase
MAGGLAGWVQGEGRPVLLLHGGPGIECAYLDELPDEIGPGYRVAMFQQRGLAPSTTEGPFDIATAVADVVAVLDALGWEHAYVVGHSWGGRLLLHVALDAPERLLGGLSIDASGGVGDGGMRAYEAALMARTPEEDVARAAALDERALSGEGTEADMQETYRLLWPAYFASRDDVPPFTTPRMSTDAYSGLYESAVAELAALEASLGNIAVPLGFLAGGASPMPADKALGATARAVPGAWVEVVDDAGHFPWYERPGCVRAALARLTRERIAP